MAKAERIRTEADEKMLAQQKQRSVSAYEGRVRLLSTLRQSFSLPPMRASILTALPREDYERYLEAPDLFPRLDTKRHLASGAQASVYLMEDSVSGCLYAAKVTTLTDPEQVRLAVKEFTLLRSLSHPGIISPLAFWIDQTLSRAMLFLPYEGDETLADIEAPSEAEVCAIGKQLFQTLAYLEKRCIVHRDVKPANVLFAGGRTKLIDFQTAMRLQDVQWTMSYAGTKQFMAPEVSSLTYTAKVDVWSGAAVLLSLLGFKTLGEVDGVSAECADWLRTTLEHDPERRLSAEEALKHSWFRCIDSS